jgi:hypothetical protein
MDHQYLDLLDLQVAHDTVVVSTIDAVNVLEVKNSESVVLGVGVIVGVVFC